jgi:hypothetical protein
VAHRADSGPQRGKAKEGLGPPVSTASIAFGHSRLPS